MSRTKASIASSVDDVRARLDLASAIRIEGRLREDLAGQPHAGAHLGPVVRVAHVVEADAGMLARIARAQPDEAAALGAHRPDMGLKAVLGREALAVIGHGERQEVILDVGIADARRASG